MEPALLLTSLLLLQPVVGLAFHERIIGGQECPEDEHPWLVQLYNFEEPYCAGTLLNSDWIITAAHCYLQDEIRVKLGVHNQDVPRGDEAWRVSVGTFCYPDSASTTSSTCADHKDDIMLIKLNSSVTYNKHISPLSLPDYASPVGTYCTVMGWGSITTSPDTYPNVPHCVSIKMLKNHFCQDAYPWWSMTDNMFCAGFLEGEKDSCRGDSGGPLVCDGQLQGIVSLGGYPCGEPLQPGIYTKVYSYLQWIQNILDPVANSPDRSKLD
ncbi:gilatoxin-like [Varanus komodoensis]|uniref:gilatoxin-like n=1 Tax=Varanus komodoensis TaxID=61221 RepID=UPI001CF7D525|nr:gilatoxin-like [Varanus komodoensis]